MVKCGQCAYIINTTGNIAAIGQTLYVCLAAPPSVIGISTPHVNGGTEVRLQSVYPPVSIGHMGCSLFKLRTGEIKSADEAD